ncbi:hypothetical protein SAMN05892883_2260 [Jatrophihabitans sp. GAS493]|uniref:hypothetical protein n=1 Tax=Jatrophihabitans sp. GAS493 TaxID=1907575 RepID=UPI000BBFB20A|nr:hypothetical protein [Jatrophihabitans sp. GAS493]SOD72949.1 hypothetical protein SAMN05892883_2260 [Jatrophihabitans sp. GAS493]
MILAIGSDKGAPGATTLATALGLVWPADRVVLELDPRGADLPFRLMTPSGAPMATAPSIVGLAVDSRPGSSPASLDRYAQPTALGVPVIPGELSGRASARISAHLPAIAAVTASWSGTVIADLGCLHAGNPAMTVGRSAEAVVLVTRPTMEGLGHLRDRIEEVTDLVANESRAGLPVGVVVVCPARDASAAVEQTRLLLASIGSPAPVLGSFAFDPPAAAGLWAGGVTKKLSSSALVRSARSISAEIFRLWPPLAVSVTTTWYPESAGLVLPQAAEGWAS